MKEVALIELGCGRPELNEPIGICTIASYLEKSAGLNAAKIALFWQKLPQHSARIEELGAMRLIGLSAQINSLDRLRDIYRAIRRANSSVPVVVGNLLGIYAGEDLLREFPDIIICTGEGELTFSLLYKEVSSAGPVDRSRWKQIPGLMYQDGGGLVKTSTRRIDLSDVPPPRRDFTASLVAAGGITRVEASRGCHWGRCEFCSVASRFGLGGYRTFSHDRVIADLECLAHEGARSPYFSDEDFFGKKYQESGELADAIISAKKSGRLPLEMNFFVSVLASDLKHPQGQAALLRWKQAGLREVFVGIEAGAENEIRRFVKKANSETNTSAINTLREMGFQIDIGFIMFDPMMSLDDLVANVEWLKKQPLQDIDSRVTKRLRVQPQTGLEKKYEHLLTGPLNVDDLTFPSGFAVDAVSRIERGFRLWEQELKMEVYSMLGQGRGEVSEPFRLLRKRALAKVRDVDIDYLQNLIMRETGELSEEKMNLLRSELLAKKRKLIQVEANVN